MKRALARRASSPRSREVVELLMAADGALRRVRRCAHFIRDLDDAEDAIMRAAALIVPHSPRALRAELARLASRLQHLDSQFAGAAR